MRNGRWLRLCTVFCVAAGMLTVQSCRKHNGIDNNTVIQTPYGLFFSDKQGALYNTNDGQTYHLLFPADGYSMRSVVTSGLNILFVKRNTHLSLDNGLNFNFTDTTVLERTPWQSIMLDVPSHGRVYLCVDSFAGVGGPEFAGVKYSTDHGKTWQVDNNYDPNTLTAPISAQSLAQLRNGDLFAYDNVKPALYKRTSAGAPWGPVTTSGLPAGRSVFLSHFNNALLAADTLGGVVYYSNDGGATFNPYPGLPGRKIRCVVAPFEQELLVGTDSAGVYRLLNGGFIAANNGLTSGSVVHAFAGKDDLYKNGVIKQYVYLASNTGLYRSEDGGQNWVMVLPGDFRRVF